jgi:hypothetical protein
LWIDQTDDEAGPCAAGKLTRRDDAVSAVSAVDRCLWPFAGPAGGDRSVPKRAPAVLGEDFRWLRDRLSGARPQSSESQEGLEPPPGKLWRAGI